MLELIPTLLAQQSKQAAPPVQPIETPVQTAAKVSTPTPASVTPIAVPESTTPEPIAIRVTPSVTSPKSSEIPQVPAVPIAVPTPKAATSAIALPPVPVQKQVTSASPQSLPSPISGQTVTAKPAEKTSSNSAALTPPPSTQRAASPQSEAEHSSSIVIPVPQATIQSTPPSTVLTQQQLLEQRLADIVAKDRAAKAQNLEQKVQPQSQQPDTLIAQIYGHATQRQYDQARKLLQTPTIPATMRSQILNNINALESANRTLSTAPTKQPIASKPTQSTARKVTLNKPAIFAGVPSLSGKSQQTLTIQVPQPIKSLPVQPRSSAAKNEPPLAIASDGAYIDQIGTVIPDESPIKAPKDLQAYNRNLPQPTSRDQIVYPLPDPVSVTSRFGWRRHPVTGVRRFHAGVDLGAGQGTPIIASRSGRVTGADHMGGYGLAVVMELPDGKQDTLYAHMSQIYVRPGQQIQAGTVIGRVGSTGLSTGPHLHYEARQKTNAGWNPVDPGAQLEAARVRLVRSRQINAQTPAPNLQSALPSSNRGV